jgi:hypothetical protein
MFLIHEGQEGHEDRLFQCLSTFVRFVTFVDSACEIG